MSEATAIIDVMDDGPFTPSGWEVRKLGELGEVKTGLTYKPDDVASHGTLVLRSSNIQNERLAFYDNVFVSKNVGEGATVHKGDILICVRNGSRRLIGKSAMINDEAHGVAFGAFMSAFRSVMNSYLIWVFQSSVVQRQIEENLGATINQITNATLKGLLVPLPPLHEQQAITAALSDADGVVAGLERVIAKKRLIKQGAMQDLLTARRRLPGFSGDWEVKRLGELGQFFKGSGVRKDDAKSGVLPCVRYGELYTVHHDVVRHFTSHISEEVAQAACKVRRGDILFAGSGETKDEIGKCAVVNNDGPVYAGGDIVGFRPANSDGIFLSYLLNAPAAQKQKASRGQGDAVVHINASALSEIQVSLPSGEEQRAISGVLEDMETEIKTLESRLTKARAVKDGMMQNLLTGRVRLF